MKTKTKYKIWNTSVLAFLTLVVMIAGYFSADWIRYFIPSYKNDRVAMDDRDFSQKPVYKDGSDQLMVFPWNYYAADKMEDLTKEEKQIFVDNGLNQMISWMLEDNLYGKNDYTQEMVRSVPYSAYFIHNFEASVDETQQSYLIDCALLHNSNLAYYHQLPVDREPVHREQLEKAYHVLRQYIEEYKNLFKRTSTFPNSLEEGDSKFSSNLQGENLNSTLSGYLLKLSVAISLYQQKEYVPIPNRYLFPMDENLTDQKEEKYPSIEEIPFDIYTMDQELLLVFPLYSDGDQYSMILFFDPVLLEFCGFSIQNTGY